jgi:DNA-binding transcriptional MerR regulator
MSEPDGLLSIGELSERTGVSRRTVRFYVQRGLIDAPIGRGRASGYDSRHVEQILRVRGLQRAGLELQHIQNLPEAAAATAFAGVRPPQVVVRLAVAEGTVLEVDASRRQPNPAILEELARACRAILERDADKRGPNEETSSQRSGQ